jgi:Nodulation protein Z (NodZ)
MQIRPTQFVVTRPHAGSGIGSNLASLAGVIWYAQQLGRSVIVDWRGSAFLKNKDANYFSEFFECPEVIQGVPILYAPAAELTADAPVVDLAEARGYLAVPCPHRVIVLRDYHGLERLDVKGDAAGQFWRLKDFYTYVRPLPFVQHEIDRFAAEHFGHAFTIGVNLSSGNGEFDKGQPFQGRVDLDIFSKDQAFLRKVEWARRLALRGVPRELRAGARIFFATDAYAMHHLLNRLPNAVTRRATFPPPGVGRVYCDYNEPGYTDRDAIVDAIVDMFLLARCHALIRNGSVFNAYALTVTTAFSGNVRHIETLYLRYWLRAIWNKARRLLRR